MVSLRVSHRVKKITGPLVSVVQSVTKIHFRNKLGKSIVGDVVSISCFCDIDTINTMQIDSLFTACFSPTLCNSFYTLGAALLIICV